MSTPRDHIREIPRWGLNLLLFVDLYLNVRANQPPWVLPPVRGDEHDDGVFHCRYPFRPESKSEPEQTLGRRAERKLHRRLEIVDNRREIDFLAR